MSKPHVCPWWMGYLLASPLRRMAQNPNRILVPHVRAGMTVIEPGPGMGFFTLELAKLIGPQGRVIAIEVQQKMLNVLMRKAKKENLQDRIQPILVSSNGTMLPDELHSKADFVLAFAVVHELPDVVSFFKEMHGALKPGGRMLLAEPAGHVDEKAWKNTVDLAVKTGFKTGETPEIQRSRTIVLTKE